MEAVESNDERREASINGQTASRIQAASDGVCRRDVGLDRDQCDYKPCLLVGDLAGACSRRINIQHRIVYQVFDDIKTVKIIRMWTHYE